MFYTFNAMLYVNYLNKTGKKIKLKKIFKKRENTCYQAEKSYTHIHPSPSFSFSLLSGGSRTAFSGPPKALCQRLFQKIAGHTYLTSHPPPLLSCLPLVHSPAPRKVV